eukprot:15475751-Alexandrium_andersonii.AAC.1
MREAEPTPELWDWTAEAGHVDWQGPARADQGLQRPPQPVVDQHAEQIGRDLTDTMRMTRCAAGPPEGYMRLPPLAKKGEPDNVIWTTHHGPQRSAPALRFREDLGPRQAGGPHLRGRQLCRAPRQRGRPDRAPLGAMAAQRDRR